jgi:hypothetical protein
MDLASVTASNLVGIASDLANLADIAVTNLLRDLNRSFVLLLLLPRSAVKRNRILVHLSDVMRVLLQHGAIVRRSRIR